LRWFRDHTGPEALARDHGISRATGYRYVDEVIAGRSHSVVPTLSPATATPQAPPVMPTPPDA
jgi:hypothetical protein